MTRRAEQPDVDMDSQPKTADQVLVTLKPIRNSLIGNRRVKAQLVHAGSIRWFAKVQRHSSS